MHEGFVRGCGSGVNANGKDRNADEDVRFGTDCMSRYPFNGIHPDSLAGLVTQFYKNYPAQQGISIEEILFELGQGHTIEQVHDRFAKGHY